MKHFILIVAAIFFGSFLSAQSIGFKLGGNLSGYLRNYDSYDDTKSILGLHIGAVGQYPVSDNVSIRADVAFNQKGERSEDNDLDSNESFRINTLDFAAGPQLNFGDAYLFAGPYISQALSGESTTEYSDGTSRTVDVFNQETSLLAGGYSDILNKFDAGVLLNFGYNFNQLFFEIGSGIGLANFYNTESDVYKGLHLLGYYRLDGDALEEDVRVRNIWLNVSIGYRLQF